MKVATEADINAYGYELMGAGKVDDAIAIFRKNVADHPASWNTYDSLGEALAQKGQTAEAVAQYTKALQMVGDDTNKTRIRGILRSSAVCRRRNSKRTRIPSTPEARRASTAHRHRVLGHCVEHRIVRAARLISGSSLPSDGSSQSEALSIAGVQRSRRSAAQAEAGCTRVRAGVRRVQEHHDRLAQGRACGDFLGIMNGGYAKALGVRCTHCHVEDDFAQRRSAAQARRAGDGGDAPRHQPAAGANEGPRRHAAGSLHQLRDVPSGPRRSTRSAGALTAGSRVYCAP